MIIVFKSKNIFYDFHFVVLLNDPKNIYPFALTGNIVNGGNDGPTVNVECINLSYVVANMCA
ncbi:MAG: hypothetical protein AB7O73_09615 [Bacteroidia bacterium]